MNLKLKFRVMDLRSRRRDRRVVKNNSRCVKRTYLKNNKPKSVFISFEQHIQIEGNCDRKYTVCIVGSCHINPSIIQSALKGEWEVLTFPEKSGYTDPSITHGDNLRLKSGYDSKTFEREVLCMWDVGKLKEPPLTFRDRYITECLVAENNRLSSKNANNIFCRDIKKLFRRY